MGEELKLAEAGMSDPVVGVRETIISQAHFGPLGAIISTRNTVTAAKVQICEVCVTTIEDGKRTTKCRRVECGDVASVTTAR